MRLLRWAVVPIVVVPIAWLLFQGLGRDPRDIGSPLIGRPAPAFELTTLDGGQLSSDDLRGRPYLINFWASWCIPACVDEHPALLDAEERYGDELAIVGVLYQDSTDGRLALEYGVTGPPETYFVDADGVVRAKHFGPMTAAALHERVAALLGVGAAER